MVPSTEENAITQEYFQQRRKTERDMEKEKGKLELSVWDFAGQHDYYYSHHHFLSTRTGFMVLWKLYEWRDNMKGLEFWFRSLATHLSSTTTTESEVYYSVMVVGTFLDHPSVRPLERPVRVEQVNELARECGLVD